MLLTGLVAALSCWNNWLLAVAIIEVVAVYVCTEVLTSNLPRTIQKSVASNCNRPDGSRSARRSCHEEKAMGRLRGELIIAFIIVMLASNAVLWFVNTEVIPISVGFDAIGSFRFSEQAWKRELKWEEQQFEEWGRERRFLPSELQSRKRMLWRFWPVAILAALGWIAIAFSIIKNTYFHAFNDFAGSAEFRRVQNRQRDISKAAERSEDLRLSSRRRRNGRTRSAGAIPH